MKKLDWNIYEDSRIARMPRLAQPAALLFRNVKENVLDFSRPPHDFDWMATYHNDGFRQHPRFVKAYARAVAAAEWDFQIPYRVHQALWCSRQAQKVEGDFVELGTGRGFMMSAVLTDFQDWDSGSRSLHLFDTFMRIALDKQGRQLSTGRISSYYAKSVEDVRNNFSEWKRVIIHQGDVFETLPDLGSESVSFLHIDLNYYKPEVYALKALWPRIPRGGVVLLDDYASRNFLQSYQAMNAVAEELGFDILSTPTGQGIIIK